MKNFTKRAVISVLLISVLFSGCSGQKNEQSQIPQQSSVAESVSDTEVTSQPDTSEEEENIKEEKYMEQFADGIVELIELEHQMPPKEGEYPAFQKYTYFSTTAGRETNVNVLLPPDYSEDKQYPVLYILHGFYDNEEWMARPTVRLSNIYNNLLAKGEAEEMIIVLPYIFCDKNMTHCTGMDEANCLAYDNFINDLTTDLMPFIESKFSVAKGRENTAITGFSMGGRESLFIGFKHPQLFGYIGAVCPAPGLVKIPGSPMHPGQMTEEEMTFTDNRPYVLFISSSKADGVVGSNPDNYRKILSDNGIAYLSHVMESTGHDHTSVKPHLYNFMKMLFK